MLVYVIQKRRLFTLTLPLKINGSYSVTDIDENNKERMLINIVEQNGKWVAFSNKHVKIYKENEALESVILENYDYLLLQIKGQEEFLVLYTCPVNDTSRIRVALQREGEFTVGSVGDNAITCNNPLISPNHIKLRYQNNHWFLRDLNSQYGTFVNGILVSNTADIALCHGDVIFIMGLKIILLGNQVIFNNPLNSVKYNSTFFREIPTLDKVPVMEASEEYKDISLYEENDYFIRSPRFMELIEEKDFKLEAHPSIQDQEDMPLLLTMGPMLTMGTTSIVMLATALVSYQKNSRDITSVLPTMAISFSMLAGTLLWPTINRNYQKKMQKKRKEKIEKKYETYLFEKNKELAELTTVQKQILLSNNISPLECYKLIIGHSRSLWMRELPQKDFLSLRLGIGRVPLKIHFNYPEEHFQLDDDVLDNKMREIIERFKYIEGAPIVESFTEKNIVAITGKYEYIKNYTDLLILQMVTLHNYYDLNIVLLTNSNYAEGWKYLKQLPHVFRNDKQMRFFATNFDEGKEITSYLQSVFKSRQDSFQKVENKSEDIYKNFYPYYMIITDDYKSIKDYPLIEEILNQEKNWGFSLLILQSTLANLPTKCKSFIGINDWQHGGIFESQLSKDTQRMFQIELLDDMDFRRDELLLANIPIENRNENFTLPKSFGFLEMYDVGNVEQLNSLEKWKVNNPIFSLAAPVGIATNGNLFKLDLHEKEQGPHGLIAGMTGSGKSEFIITYILSMAINYHPDEVQFVLIDYKGGGLVGAFENKELGIKLPHLAGTITNLDTADINRALASIESELKRRQALFNEAREKLNEGTIDIYKYQKYYREELLDTPVSHLFIISDEFAELKSQQPEFMDQLISTARIGRSLGVHLILSTQKPSGIVNDQIWSNTRFRVCLKVQDSSDSNEVIKRPDAAALKEVGRFYLQVGYDEFFAMGQGAYAGTPYIPQDKVYHEVDDKISFINNIGKSIKTIDTPRKDNIIAKGEELSNVVKYLDSLAKKENIQVRQLWLEKLSNEIFVDTIKQQYHFEKKNFQLEIIFGAYDNPKAQSQGLLTLNLTDKGNAVIYSMNEKNTIVNTIIYSLITTYHTKEVNIYIMDLDSQTMKIYKNAPQVGDVIFGNEGEKINKLFNMLAAEIDRRKVLFQEYNGSYEFYCKNSGNTIPSIVFILYGYENFKESFEDKDSFLSKISREGFKYGIYTILTAISDRSLRLSMRSNFPQIIPLKLSAPIEYNMLLGKKAPMIADIEGRGVVLVDDEPYEFQTAIICPNDKQNEYIKDVCISLNQQIKEKAPIVRILPEHVTWEDIIVQPISLNKIPIGLEEDTLDVSYYNITSSFIHLISATEVSALVSFSQELVAKLMTIPDIITMVDDEKGYYRNAGNIAVNNFNSIHDMIFNVGRNKPLLVFITGIEKWLTTIPTDINSNLLEYFNKINALHNCYFILIDRLDDIKSLSYEKWFKQFVSTDNSIFVGRGINNSTIHNLITPLRTLSIPIPPNYGYNIKNGIAISIKVVEGNDNHG